ncbi:uncharacterized protein LOC131845203 [Achroia grisella]|uniref:uncharacterized protein LOC131845203 n=1 Tax=Achroia grisella TaxID=688607 RepID=UPI0027D31745|nr:uncharacterized protein LOC131845203 [Achroia grisella]
MYHFQNHPYFQDHAYHNNQAQHCPSFQEDKPQNCSSSIHNNVYTVLENVPTSQDCDNKMKTLEMTKEKPNKLSPKKSAVDTSNFTVEERLVAAVWVHERKRSKTTLGHIKKEFRQRFGREPPAKNTLLAWERKLFSLGSVHDAPRPGRPINRRIKVEEVAASIRSAPSLSLRERAVALRLSRTTLHTILHKDLQHLPRSKEDPVKSKGTGKQIKKRRPRAENMKKQTATVQYENAPFLQSAVICGAPSTHLLTAHGFS